MRLQKLALDLVNGTKEKARPILRFLTQTPQNKVTTMSIASASSQSNKKKNENKSETRRRRIKQRGKERKEKNWHSSTTHTLSPFPQIKSFIAIPKATSHRQKKKKTMKNFVQIVKSFLWCRCRPFKAYIIAVLSMLLSVRLFKSIKNNIHR